MQFSSSARLAAGSRRFLRFRFLLCALVAAYGFWMVFPVTKLAEHGFGSTKSLVGTPLTTGGPPLGTLGRVLEPSGLGAPDSAGNAAQVLEAMYQRFLSKLYELPPWTDYINCRKERGDGCEQLWTTAVYLALALGMYTGENLSVGETLLDDHPSGDLQSALNTQLESEDPLRRIVILGLLHVNSRAQGQISLPPNVYADLNARSVVETQLILARHSFKPLPSDSVAVQVHAIATSTNIDRRILRVAVLALGESRNADLLLDVARNWLSPRGADIMDPDALLVALRRCGRPCVEGIEAMARDERPEVRERAADALSEL